MKSKAETNKKPRKRQKVAVTTPTTSVVSFPAKRKNSKSLDTKSKADKKKKPRKRQTVADRTSTTSVVSFTATSSQVEECTEAEEAEVKFTKLTVDRNVTKKRSRASSSLCDKHSTRSRRTKRPKTEKNATELEGSGKQETDSENYMRAESSNSQNHLPHGRDSSDSFTEYLHRQMLQDPQFIIGLMEGHDKSVQVREERRSTLRNLPSRDCASARRRAADCIEHVFDPLKAMLETLQELRNSNKELEDRIAVLTARRDQLQTISGIVSDIHQSYLQCFQNQTIQEPCEGTQQLFEDPPQSFDDHPQQASEDLQQASEDTQTLSEDP